MDYWKDLDVYEYSIGNTFSGHRIFLRGLHLLTTHAEKSIWDVSFQKGDGLIFGNEGHGAPESIHNAVQERIKIPQFKKDLTLPQPCCFCGNCHLRGNSPNPKVIPPLVSIILPCRNASNVIDRCLSSIVDQTLKDWELVAIDDRSTDDSTFDLLILLLPNLDSAHPGLPLSW